MLALQDTKFRAVRRSRLMSEKKLMHSQATQLDLVLESYGVRFGIQASSQNLLTEAEQTARKALLERVQTLEDTKAEHLFAIEGRPDGELHLSLNGEHLANDTLRPRFFRFFDSMLRLTVAEYARDLVFIHAGVVGHKGKAILIPAHSFRGKTTLVGELVKNGAEYYSDEYAVLDADGLVHPFARDMSVRYYEGRMSEKHVTAGSLGGKVGRTPIPVGLVLLTEFVENAVWKPERLTVGQGIIEMIPHTIPRRYKPEFSLKVLNTAVSDAIILRSSRGDAVNFAPELMSFFDNFSDLAKIT